MPSPLPRTPAPAAAAVAAATAESQLTLRAELRARPRPPTPGHRQRPATAPLVLRLRRLRSLYIYPPYPPPLLRAAPADQSPGAARGCGPPPPPISAAVPGKRRWPAGVFVVVALWRPLPGSRDAGGTPRPAPPLPEWSGAAPPPALPARARPPEGELILFNTPRLQIASIRRHLREPRASSPGIMAG